VVESDPPLSVLGSTAVSVAACRAIESARIDAWFHDELAQHVVTKTGLPALSRGLVAWVAVRTRFLDELVTRAVADLPRAVTVFEVDHAEVLSMKQRLLDEAELISTCRRMVVVADLVDDDWLAKLADTGWDRARATLWVVEGLLVYLTHDERTQLLQRLSSASGIGSVLGATLSTRTDELAHPLWHPPGAVDNVEWLAACGWRASVQTMADASEEFGRPVSAEFRTSTKARLVLAYTM
jgi:O-methyltransferase involved in polyketide biosynthesis